MISVSTGKQLKYQRDIQYVSSGFVVLKKVVNNRVVEIVVINLIPGPVMFWGQLSIIRKDKALLNASKMFV